MDKIKTFKRIMEKSNSNRVVILTNHYQNQKTMDSYFY